MIRLDRVLPSLPSRDRAARTEAMAACCGLVEGYEADGGNKKISSVPSVLRPYNPFIDTTEKGPGSDKFTENNRTSLSSPCHLARKDLPRL